MDIVSAKNHGGLAADGEAGQSSVVDENSQGSAPGALRRRAGAREGGADQVKTLPRIAAAEVVIHGVLKVVFHDDYEDVVDLKPLIAKGKGFRLAERTGAFRRRPGRRVRTFGVVAGQ